MCVTVSSRVSPEAFIVKTRCPPINIPAPISHRPSPNSWEIAQARPKVLPFVRKTVNLIPGLDDIMTYLRRSQASNQPPLISKALKQLHRLIEYIIVLMHSFRHRSRIIHLYAFRPSFDKGPLTVANDLCPRIWQLTVVMD